MVLKGRGNARNPPKVVYDEYIRCFTKKTITVRAATIGHSPRSIRDGYGRQGPADRDAASHIVGNAGSTADAEYPTVWRKFASNLVDAQPLRPATTTRGSADQVIDHFIKFFTT